ncbi:MAG: ketose-bisphosphate aldolase [Halanaerobiales bacterium]
MGLVTLNEVLKKSVTKNRAVGSFNVTNHQMVEGVIAAAEEKRVPVIISIAEVHLKYLDLDIFIPYLMDRIMRTEIPVVLHLDHGMSYETVVKAIHYGFSSVMIDASNLPYEENVALTKKVTETAHAAGVSVEAELGHVAGGEGNLVEGTDVDLSAFTRPEEAARFVEETDIDALAVAVGTVHGPYKGQPNLDFKLLKTLEETVPVPLVLHGGSGLTADDFKKAIKHGISKINFYTQASISGVEAIKELLSGENPVSLPELTLAAQYRVKEVVANQMDIYEL